MILAAGRGERMRPLTDSQPKPLLQVGGKPLIHYHLEALYMAGFRQLVVNTAWLGEQLELALGDGSDWGLEIAWSREGEALETAGGMMAALPLLGGEPFLVVNGDIWTRYDFAPLRHHVFTGGVDAHLVMVPNPAQHPGGDFRLGSDGMLGLAQPGGGETCTYSGIAIVSPDFLQGWQPGKLALRPLLDQAIPAGRVSAELYRGPWHDVGTPKRLAELDAELGLP